MVFRELDMFPVCWQIHLNENVQEITAFKCKYGSFQFLVMPSGLMNAPVMFQRMVNELFGDMDFVPVYIDHVVFQSKTLDEHL